MEIEIDRVIRRTSKGVLVLLPDNSQVWLPLKRTRVVEHRGAGDGQATCRKSVVVPNWLAKKNGMDVWVYEPDGLTRGCR